MSRGKLFLSGTILVFLLLLSGARILDGSILLHRYAVDIERRKEEIGRLEIRFLDTARPLVSRRHSGSDHESHGGDSFEADASAISADLAQNVDPSDPLIRGTADTLAGILNRRRILLKELDLSRERCRLARQTEVSSILGFLMPNTENVCE